MGRGRRSRPQIAQPGPASAVDRRPHRQLLSRLSRFHRPGADHGGRPRVSPRAAGTGLGSPRVRSPRSRRSAEAGREQPAARAAGRGDGARFSAGNGRANLRLAGSRPRPVAGNRVSGRYVATAGRVSAGGPRRVAGTGGRNVRGAAFAAHRAAASAAPVPGADVGHLRRCRQGGRPLAADRLYARAGAGCGLCPHLGSGGAGSGSGRGRRHPHQAHAG